MGSPFVHLHQQYLASMAAAYGFGSAKNHPFVDGNERVAFQALYLFLGLNGLRIDASEEQVVTVLAPSSFLQTSPAHRGH